jgi:hypothetical protein
MYSIRVLYNEDEYNILNILLQFPIHTVVPPIIYALLFV